MENTSACIRQLTEADLSDSSKTMGPSSDSQHFSASSESMMMGASSDSQFFSASNESLMERTESAKCTSIEEQIEHSKSHWSEVVESDSDEDEAAEVSNVEVFKNLQMHPTWGTFFQTSNEGELVIGKKFAEGGQAELYEAQVKWIEPSIRELELKQPREYVLKVFKAGTYLRHLRSQWPKGMLQLHAERLEVKRTGITPEWMSARYNCAVDYGTLLEDGRFAFVMQREQADLRGLIDRNMLIVGKDRGPFSKQEGEWIMYRIALGMDFLHGRNIVHRDLKASNVLVNEYGRDYKLGCFVADYECSIGVVGTGFFRAPEILQACKDQNLSRKPKLFTKEVDVYSFGMTCYEILTGKLPFEGHSWRDYDLVLSGSRPEVPTYVDDWSRELLSRCWHSNPTARPTFGEILEVLSTNSVTVQIERRSILEKKLGLRRRHIVISNRGCFLVE